RGCARSSLVPPELRRRLEYDAEADAWLGVAAASAAVLPERELVRLLFRHRKVIRVAVREVVATDLYEGFARDAVGGAEILRRLPGDEQRARPFGGVAGQVA